MDSQFILNNILLLLGIVILVLFTLFITNYVIGLKNKKKEHVDENENILIESIIKLYGYSELQSETNIQDSIGSYIKSFQKNEDFQFLSLVINYQHFVEENNIGYLNKLVLSLRKLSKHPLYNDYYNFYNNLLNLLQIVYYQNPKDKSDDLCFDILSSIQKQQINSHEEKVLRQYILKIYDTFPNLSKIFNYLAKLKAEQLDEQDFSALYNYRNIIKNNVELLKSFNIQMLETEKDLMFDIFDSLEINIDNKINRYSNRKSSHGIIEQYLSIQPVEIRIQKNDCLPIQFEIKNSSLTLCDDVFYNILIRDEDKIDKDNLGKINLGPISPGQSKEISFEYFPHKLEDNITFKVEIGYRQPTGLPISKKVPIKLMLHENDNRNFVPPYQTQPKNNRIQHFFGRKKIIAKLSRLINNYEEVQTIGLFGLARVGKTSLLFEVMSKDVTNNNIFVYFNMDDATFSSNNWHNLMLIELYNTINKKLIESGFHVNRNKQNKNMSIELIALFESVNDQLIAKNQFITLIIDEYHRIEEDTTPTTGIQKNDIIRLFKQIAVGVPRVSLVLCGYHDIYTLSRYDNTWSANLGKGFTSIKLGFLDKDSTLELIKLPMSKFGISYDAGIPDEIYNWTRGYPWYTQLICSELFEYTFEDDISKINKSHLDDVVKNIIFSEDEYFQHILSAKWAGPMMEIILFVIAKSPNQIVKNEDGLKYVPREYIFDKLNKLNVKIEKGNFLNRIESMTRKDVLDSKEFENCAYCAIAIPLLEKWNKNKGDLETSVYRLTGRE